MLKANFRRWKKTAELKMAVQAMDQSKYKTLLISLAAQQTTARSLLCFDDSQLNAVLEEPLLRPDDKPLEAHQYMPRFDAPKQQNQFPIEALSPQKKRCCAWFPFCYQFVWQCNGYDRQSCLRANSGDFQTPTEDAFKEKKTTCTCRRERRATRGKRREV